MIDRETVISSIQELPSETKVKAWVFEIDKKFYHIARYTRFRMPEACSIWESTKKGKRNGENPIFTLNGADHVKCINEFMDKIDLENIDKGAE
jgi:hypothetical protein